MDKKSGGIRPIVVGYVWRRLAEKCARAQAIDTLADYFTLLQLDVEILEAVRPQYTPLCISFLACPMTTSLQIIVNDFHFEVKLSVI